MDTRVCNCCGKTGPVAEDQTDPGADETAVDSLGLVARNLYVCGACLDKGLASREANEAAIELERGVVDGD